MPASPAARHDPPPWTAAKAWDFCSASDRGEENPIVNVAERWFVIGTGAIYGCLEACSVISLPP
jgi:hypothetical protein